MEKGQGKERTIRRGQREGKEGQGKGKKRLTWGQGIPAHPQVYSHPLLGTHLYEGGTSTKPNHRHTKLIITGTRIIPTAIAYRNPVVAMKASSAF